MYRYGPVWAPDSKKLLFWDKMHRLWYVGVEEKKPVQVDQSGFADISDGAWAPDSQWIAYSKTEGRGGSQLYLYSLAQKKTSRISNGYYNDGNPAFDPEGKYVFFISQRFFFPSISRIDQRFNYYTTDGVFALTLKADTPSPFKAQSDDEKAADKEKDKDKKDDKDKKNAKKDDASGDEQKDESKKDEKKQEAPKPVQVDFGGIADRVVPVPIPSGIYNALVVRKGKFFYIAQPQESLTAGTEQDGTPRGVLHVYDLEKREDKEVIGGIEGYDADREGKKVVYKAGPVLGVIEAAPGKKVGEGKLDLSGMQVNIDPRQEWRQTFHEAWRIERDFYWDPDMTGHDWKKIGARYEALLPWVAHRSDLNYLLGELIAELSTSHLCRRRRRTQKAAHQRGHARRRTAARWWILSHRQNLSRRKLARSDALPAHRTRPQSESRGLSDCGERPRNQIIARGLFLLPESCRKASRAQGQQQTQRGRRLGNHRQARRQ